MTCLFSLKQLNAEETNCSHENYAHEKIIMCVQDNNFCAQEKNISFQNFRSSVYNTHKNFFFFCNVIGHFIVI